MLLSTKLGDQYLSDVIVPITKLMESLFVRDGRATFSFAPMWVDVHQTNTHWIELTTMAIMNQETFDGQQLKCSAEISETIAG
jgi:hypothetical protein